MKFYIGSGIINLRIVEKFEAFIIAICLFLLIPPYFVWFYPSVFRVILISLCFIVSLRHFKFERKNSGYYPLLLFVLFLYFFFLSDEITILSFVRHCLFTSLIFIDCRFFKKIFNAFCIVFSLTIIPSIIQYAMVELFGFHFSYQIIPPLNELNNYDYYCYAFYVKPYSFSILPRFCSFYDEPGVVGTISAFILALKNFNLRDKFNIPVLIAGIFSFSLYFYLVAVIYIVFFVKDKRYRGYILLASCVVVFVLQYVYTDNPLLEKYIFNRLEYDPDKGFVGNNRNLAKFDEWYSDFRNSSDYLLGLGRNAKRELDLNQGGASYKDRIVEYGIIGFGLYVILMLLWAYRRFRNNQAFFVFLMLFITILFQRPFIMVPFYFILIFSPIAFLEKERIK